MKLFLIFMLIYAFSNMNSEAAIAGKTDNPFFKNYDTPFEVPPFDKIKFEHFLPAVEEGIKQQQTEINAIVNNQETPTFENTLEAMDNSGKLLSNVTSVLFNLLSANTSDELQQISKDASPLLSKNSDDIILNEKLFARIKILYDQKDKLNLRRDQSKLLEDTYKRFTKRGVNLSEKDKEKLRSINSELSLLSLQFSENLLKETNAFKLVIDNEKDLDGLPANVITGAADEAKKNGMEGKWVFTLQKPSLIPFITYADNRELREKIYKGYYNRGDNNNERDNKELIKKIVALRIEKAKLLGYDTHAEYVLDDTMAKTPENVYKLLNRLWDAALPMAKKEADELQKMIYAEGNNFKLESWDWWYYTEKLKKAKYDLDEEEIRPYFQMENVRKGAFDLAGKLWGITFTELQRIPTYHPEVTVYEVKEKDGRHIGLLYTDYFPRDSKRGGAWMNSLRRQNKDVTPVICNVGNFSKPAGDTPGLLSLDEVNTLFHEFGHGLHGLLSKTNYISQSGTSVSRDFVELPSQVMENWVTEPEILKTFAFHYKTGEVIPDDLIEKIQKTAHFNQGFITVEYLAASLLDMKYHTLKSVSDLDVNKFETEALNEIGLIPEIISRYRSTYFQHIFSSGYDAGYYSYIWAGVLDADAFEAFKETSLYDQKTAASFRENVLSKGGTEDPMVLYKNFRGKEPSIEPLLKRRGLVQEPTI
jgi:peptidyl-dipeptidase Dcp